MSVMGRILGTVSNFVQFFPLSVFAAYAFRHGAPTNERWIAAFELAAAAAILQLVVLLPQRRPTNRLILGANLYLLAGGAAALAQQWWLLQAYGVLKEAGIFLFMLGVGLVTTFATSSGFVAGEGATRPEIRRASLWLLGATATAVVAAFAFQGHRAWAAVVPVIALALLQRTLRSRLQSRAAVESAAPSASLVRRLASVAVVVVVVGGLVSRTLVGMATPGSDSPGVYDVSDVVRADYSGLPAPRMPKIRDLAEKAARGDATGQDAIVLRFSQPAASADPLQVLGYSFRMMVSLSPHRDLSRDLAAIRQPLLILVGARDESFFPERYEAYMMGGLATGPPNPPTLVAVRETRAAPRMTFTVLPEVSHLGLVVKRRTAEEIAAWLGRLP